MKPIAIDDFKQRPHRVLVTGGAGFIGSTTVHQLLAHGYEVVVLDNLSSGKLSNLSLTHPKLEFIEGDVLNYSLVAHLVTRCDSVLHLAAIASVAQSIHQPLYSFQVNVQGFLHVCDAIRSAKHPIRLVFASSAAVYGNANHLPSDDEKLLCAEQLSPYALQKMQTEEYADLYAKLFGIKSLALRYFNVYGPGQDPHSSYSGVISRFIDAYQAKKTLTIFGDGKQTRDFIHVDDIAKANLAALASAFTGKLNVATGQPETLLSLIDYIEMAGHHTASREFKPPRIGDIYASYGSTRLLAEKLAFRATISLREGIGSLLEYMRHRSEKINELYPA